MINLTGPHFTNTEQLRNIQLYGILSKHNNRIIQLQATHAGNPYVPVRLTQI